MVKIEHNKASTMVAYAKMKERKKTSRLIDASLVTILFLRSN